MEKLVEAAERVGVLYERGEDHRGVAERILSVWKRNGDIHDPEKYRGITLPSHVLNVLERILDRRLRSIVEC